MAESNITQQEADTLFKMEKRRVDDTEYDFSELLRNKISIPLVSNDKKEDFFLDISKGRMDLKRQKYQNRTRSNVILARLDFGAPHRNPPELGGKEVGVPHLHIYREGFGSKYAIKVPDEISSDANEPWKILHDFMQYCNIVSPPKFKRGFF